MFRACVAVLFAILASAGVKAEDDYSTLLANSYLFYQGQMSGALPAWNQLLASKPSGWRKSGHLNDGAPISKDLSGGFYDAGDYLKCPMPLGWAIANLAWSALEFKPAYDTAGQWTTALNIAKWGADWMIKAHTTASDAPSANVFVGQLGDKGDHQYFGRPEHATNVRPVYTVTAATGGADVAAEYAAAFAAAAVLFRNSSDAAYAATLFKRAQQAFGFAEAYKSNWVVPAGVFQAYSTWATNGYLAHLAFASAWMCKYSATYCPTAEQYFTAGVQAGLQYSLGYDWDSTLPGAAVLLLSMNLQTSAARNFLENLLLAKWEDTTSVCPKPSYSAVCYTAKGLAYYSDWGTLRNTGNMMFIASLMGKYAGTAAAKQQHICWSRMQMRYITGSLANTGKSYVIGYGTNQPQQPHHRQSACSPTYNEPCSPFNQGTCCAGESGVGPGGCCDSANFFNSHSALTIIKGALVGGPDQNDMYPDVRSDYQRSEVAIDYNAGFTGAAAALAYYAANGQLAACGAGPVTPTPSPSPAPQQPSPSPAGPRSPSPSPSPSPTPSPSPVASPAPAVASPSPSPSPSPPSPPAAGCTATVLPWSKCGGFGDVSNCPAELFAAGKCTDAVWPGYCCTSGYSCKRDNAFWWACTPGTGPSETSPSPSPEPSPSPSPSPKPSPSPSPKPSPSPSPKPSPSPSPKPSPSPSPKPSPPPPAGSCTAPSGPWQQCGGRKDGCATCTDAPWQGQCCQAGYKCTRDNEWWWMCTPDQAVVRVAPEIAGCNNIVESWAACGGKSGCPADVIAAGKCRDAPWEGYCCTMHSACVRTSEYYYQCQPTLTATAAAADTVLTAAAAAATPDEAIAAAASASTEVMIQNSYDALVVEIPSSTLPARRNVTVAAVLTRQGRPVRGATVQFTFRTTKKRLIRPNGRPAVVTATVEGRTRSRGRAVIQLPRRVVGFAGDVTVITAVTADARARGVKGTVVLSSQDVVADWA